MGNPNGRDSRAVARDSAIRERSGIGRDDMAPLAVRWRPDAVQHTIKARWAAPGEQRPECFFAFRLIGCTNWIVVDDEAAYVLRS